MSRSLRHAARATGLFATAVACVLAGSALAPPAQASRSVSESYPVPSGGVYQVTGHGYGHGRGMSQYGALGAARKGLSYQQIVSFYYPGTTLRERGGLVRVLISADTDNDVRVVPTSGLRVREVSSGATYPLATPKGATVWRLRTVSGKTVLDYHDGRWRTHRPGGRVLAGAAEFYRSGTLTLKVAGSNRVYRGAMRLASNDTVNVLSLEDYIKGVVPKEMPASWTRAAVQAQAVAARSYAVWERAAHYTRHHQTCDTTSCQVYGGVAAEDPRSNAAVDETRFKVLLHGGKPAFTQFGSSSGGWTSAGSRPYLVAQADKYDDHSGNPVHTWTVKVSRSTIQKAWTAIGTLQRIRVTEREGHGEWSGRVESMVLDGTRRNLTISGATFRSKLGLRSHWFHFGSAAAGVAEPMPSSPITARWKRLGGQKSYLRKPTSDEYSRAGGRVRRFERGRIYWVARVGVRDMNGSVLREYLRIGELGSKLAFPTSRPKLFRYGVYATFEHGAIRVYRSGRVQVIHR